MKNLINKLVGFNKKQNRSTRNYGRRAVSSQIAKMGRMGQQLVVASR